jgi:DNA-binding CsgD family transcriptional regulator
MLVGRSHEMAAVERLLSDGRDGHGGALVLHGEAGVGKSALLRYAKDQAEAFLVLHAVGIESEAELDFAGLHQLLHPVLDHLSSLPGPQADAVRAAFALSAEPVAERFRISLGALGLLAAAAEDRPVLCMVDDAQWLDQASASALAFVARRVEAERVIVLVGVRDDSGRSFDAAGLAELPITALRDDAARALVSTHLGAAAADTALDWVLANANGNPLALIELPRALSDEQLSGREPLSGIAPPATSVERAYLSRVARLPSRAQHLLLLAAAEDIGDRGTIRRAAELAGLGERDLSEAESAGLVTVGRDQITFRHPLLRSAIYRGASFTDREQAHSALAAVLSDPSDADRRAWHRAAATTAPDDEVAAELEASADRAHLRAGYSGAATALERSAGLSSARADRTRRLVRAARSAWQAGQPDRATALLDAVGGELDDARQRAERAHILGLVEMGRGELLTAGSILLEGADEVSAHDPRKALEMLLDAGSSAGRSGNVARIVDVGTRAAALPAGAADPKDELLCDLLVGVGGLITSETAEEVPRIRSAIGRAADYDDPRVLSWAAIGASTIGDDVAEAALLTRAMASARASGSVDTLVLMLEAATSGRHVSGRYTLAAESAEGLRLAREVGLTNAATAFRAMLCWVAGMEGDDDACHEYADEVTAAARNGMANASSIAQWAVALLDLARGAPDQAVSRLSGLRTAPPGESHPFFVLMSTPELVEADLLTGDAARAAADFAALETFAQPGAPLWALGFAARCRALLADGETAEHEFDSAVRLMSEAKRPFEKARTQLLYGQFLRRHRRRADAREQLRAAAQSFERQGAEPWAERARSELRASGETARKRDPSTAVQLTPQETQIARLVGEGCSNKDVATQLFLSPRTVEYHLAKIFTKLGIASRADLIRQAHALEPVG